MSIEEIVLPNTKPETEWVRGRATPLVPDLAFVAYERMHDCSDEEIQTPAFAPTIAIEVLSGGDDPRDVASKIDVYLRGGCELVIVADPKTRTLRVHDREGQSTLRGEDILRHPVLEGLEIPLATFFARALDRMR